VTVNSTVFGTANRCDSEQHNAAYRAERTERELGLTVVLNVCVGNIVMGKEIVITESKQRMALNALYCYSVLFATNGSKTCNVCIT